MGYNAFWMAEHHFQREGTECIPNVLLMALHLTHVTRNLKIGCGFNIAPMWHPLRLAEDYAMADILSGGRVVFGLGRGYHTREVETFGSPLIDQDANRELFEEQVDIIFKAFNEEQFSHKGKHYTLPPEVPYRGYDAEGADTGSAAGAPAGGDMAADPGRHRARAGIHGQARHPGHGRRRLGRGRRDAQGGAGLAGGACQVGQAHRARRAAVLRVPFLHGGQPRGGDPQGGEILRREHEDVRRAAPGARADRGADRDHARSEACAGGKTAADRGCDRRGRVPVRLAAADDRSFEGAGGKVSGTGSDLRQPVGRRAGVRSAGAVGTFRYRGDAGVQGRQGSRCRNWRSSCRYS